MKWRPIVILIILELLLRGLC
ncbi:hypothetical protein ACT7DP_22465 [Bacillus paranthracis]